MGRLRFTSGVRQDTITHGDVTFSFGENVTAGNFVDGPAWVVVPSGTVALNEPTPAQTTYSGNVANGCMVNPVVGQQGYDQRIQWSSFNAGLVASTWPRAVQAGDVVVKAVSREVLSGPVGAEARGGVCDSYGALFVLEGPPPPGSFAPAAVGWPGRGAPQPIVLGTSIADFVASLPVFDMNVVAGKPPYDKIMEMLDRWCPAGQRYDLIYESLFPWGMGFTPTPNNYGRDSGSLFQAAALSLLRSDFTAEQKRAIATRLVSWGIQFSDPSVGSGAKYTTDGGHYQFHQSAALLYLHLTGQASRIANFLEEQGGNFNQAFRVTAQNVAEDFVRHTNPFKPCTYRERQVVASSGNSLTFQATRFPLNGGGDTPNFSVRNLVAKRVSDGASAYVTAVGSVVVAANTTTNLTVTIDAQPTPPFAPGDVIWFEPPVGAEPQAGDADWRLLPGIETFNPSWNATYRELNYWSGHVMFLDAIGLIEAAGLQVVRDWVIRANKLNTPLPTFDFRPTHKAFVDRDLRSWNFDRDFWNAHWASIYFDPLNDFTYSEAVTSTDSLNEQGDVERLVTSPAHLAAYDAGEGVPGLYRFPPSLARSAPVVLYPGQIAMSPPNTGGTLSLVQAPWAVGVGTVSIAYRVMFGDTEVATSLPYSVTQTAGSVLRVLANVTASGVTTTVEVGRVAVQENPLGPQLSDFRVDYDANTINFVSDLAATVTWRRYPPGYQFTNQAAEILAGTGAIEGGTFDITAGLTSRSVPFVGGVEGPQEFWAVARVGSGPLSNPIGEAVSITPASAVLTSPNFRGSSLGGDGTGVGVVSANVALPAYNSGDTVFLQIGIDCAAGQVAGLTITAPNGETVVQRQALVDNEVTGDSGQSVGLWYYRATAPNTSGFVTIAITAGGVKSAEQIICTPVARFNVKADGDPIAQVVKTFSSTATSIVSTAALTAVNAASRIEAFIVSEFDQPAGTVPETWALRQVGRFGPQSIQSISRNAAVEAAGQSIAAVSLPLPVARRWTGLTYEILPLGA